jgi:serine/threonine protein kinase
VYHGKLLGMDVAVKSFKIETQMLNNNIQNPNTTTEEKDNAIKAKRNEVKERFEAEGHLMLRLRHPHIIQLLGVCPMEGTTQSTESPLLVFEYLESGSLSHYIHEVTQAPLDHATLFSVGRDIALALNYLHNRKLPIVHLDVKSANVLLDAYLRAKIADLGLAQPLPPTKKNVSEKSVTLCCLKGTPAFMSPEVLKDRYVSIAADVYGFGIILWEMSVALKPFHGMNLMEVSTILNVI